MEGVGYRVEEVSRARRLAHAGLLRAGLRFRDGEPEKAFDDLLTVVCLGRHLTHSDCVLGYLAGAAVEQRAFEQVGRFAWAATDPADWKRFRRRFDTLAPGRPLADAVVAEGRGYAAWIRRCGPPTPAERRRGTGGIGFVTLRSIIGWDTPEQAVEKTAAAVEREYRFGADRLRRPAADAAAAEDEHQRRMRLNFDWNDPITHQLLGLLTPAFGKLRSAEVRLTAGRAMLRAVAGETVPPAGRDADGVAYTARPTATGYILRSALVQASGQPFEMAVRSVPPPR